MTGYTAPSLPYPRYLQPKYTYIISFHHSLVVKKCTTYLTVHHSLFDLIKHVGKAIQQ